MVQTKHDSAFRNNLSDYIKKHMFDCYKKIGYFAVLFFSLLTLQTLEIFL